MILRRMCASTSDDAAAGLKDTLATVQTELQLQSSSLSDVRTAVAANSKVSYELSHRVERNTAAQDLLKKLAGQITPDRCNSTHANAMNATVSVWNIRCFSDSQDPLCDAASASL